MVDEGQNQISNVVIKKNVTLQSKSFFITQIYNWIDIELALDDRLGFQNDTTICDNVTLCKIMKMSKASKMQIQLLLFLLKG